MGRDRAELEKKFGPNSGPKRGAQ